ETLCERNATPSSTSMDRCELMPLAPFETEIDVVLAAAGPAESRHDCTPTRTTQSARSEIAFIGLQFHDERAVRKSPELDSEEVCDEHSLVDPASARRAALRRVGSHEGVLLRHRQQRGSLLRGSAARSVAGARDPRARLHARPDRSRCPALAPEAHRD